MCVCVFWFLFGGQVPVDVNMKVDRVQFLSCRISMRLALHCCVGLKRWPKRACFSHAFPLGNTVLGLRRWLRKVGVPSGSSSFVVTSVSAWQLSKTSSFAL